MAERRVVLDVQARDGSRLNLVTELPAEPLLRLTLPALAPAEFASPAVAFFRLSRDPANLVLDCLDPDSWLELEKTCRAGRVATVSSGLWEKVGDGGKPVYVRQRRALFRVSRAFQVCCLEWMVGEWVPWSQAKLPVSPSPSILLFAGHATAYIGVLLESIRSIAGDIELVD